MGRIQNFLKGQWSESPAPAPAPAPSRPAAVPRPRDLPPEHYVEQVQGWDTKGWASPEWGSNTAWYQLPTSHVTTMAQMFDARAREAHAAGDMESYERNSGALSYAVRNLAARVGIMPSDR